MTGFGAFMRTDFFLSISLLKVASGPRVKLTGCKNALNPSEVHSTDHSVGQVLFLLFVALCSFCFKYFFVKGSIGTQGEADRL